MANIIQKEDLGSDFTNDDSLTAGGIGVDKTQLVTIGSGAPSGAPAAGEPLDYYDNSGTPWVQYRWDGSAWQPVTFNYENWLLSNLPAAPETLTPRPNVYIDDSTCPAVLNFWDPCADSNNGAYVQVFAVDLPEPLLVVGDFMPRATSRSGGTISQPDLTGLGVQPFHSPNPDTNVLVLEGGGTTSIIESEVAEPFAGLIVGTFSDPVPDVGWVFLNFDLSGNAAVTSARSAFSGLSSATDANIPLLLSSSEQVDQIFIQNDSAWTYTFTEAELTSLSSTGAWILISDWDAQGTAGGNGSLTFDGGAVLYGTVDLAYTATGSLTYDILRYPSGFYVYVLQTMPYTLT